MFNARWLVFRYVNGTKQKKRVHLSDSKEIQLVRQKKGKGVWCFNARWLVFRYVNGTKTEEEEKRRKNENISEGFKREINKIQNIIQST